MNAVWAYRLIHSFEYSLKFSLDNRQAPRPHFAAPPAPKPAPTILQTINTAGSSLSMNILTNVAVTAVGKARASLGPNINAPRSRVPRISNVGIGGTVYQRFALPGGPSGGGRRLLENIDEKPVIGGFGGLTEKDIEEKASFLLLFRSESTRLLDLWLFMSFLFLMSISGNLSVVKLPYALIFSYDTLVFLFMTECHCDAESRTLICLNFRICS